MTVTRRMLSLGRRSTPLDRRAAKFRIIYPDGTGDTFFLARAPGVDIWVEVWKDSMGWARGKMRQSKPEPEVAVGGLIGIDGEPARWVRAERVG